MALSITIHPESSPSPYQLKQPKAPNIVNDNFLSGFGDLLDIINPLQHIPGVSTIYQAVTGDKPSMGAEIAGGALFGGPIGFVASIINAIVEQETGSGVTSHLYAMATDSYQKTSNLS